jgi:hypothetical protein
MTVGMLANLVLRKNKIASDPKPNTVPPLHLVMDIGGSEIESV